MLSRHKQSVFVFRRVRDFLKDNPPEAGFGSIEKVVAQLDTVIARLEAHAADQDARFRGVKAGTEVSRAQVAALRQQFMRPLTHAARILFPQDAALLAALGPSPARDYTGTLAAAEAMVQIATTRKEAFVDFGLAPDFVERMVSATADLRARLDARSADIGRRAASTAGLHREYLVGREVVRMLDAMVAPRLEATPTRLAAWRAVSRFARLGPPLPLTPTPVQPPAPEPASPPRAPAEDSTAQAA